MKLTQYLSETLEHRAQTGIQTKEDLQQFKQLPFYCKWTSYMKKGYCSDIHPRCFNHMVGLPVKNGITHELYDFEHDIVNYLERDEPADPKNKHLYILKSAGLGATTLLLRYIAWKCTTNDQWSNGRVCILTAPRIDLTIDLVNRLKVLFKDKLEFSEKNKVYYLNSHLGLKGMRGLTDIKMILADESSFFDINQIQEARETKERYWAKNNPIIVLCSTPSRPGDLMDQCIYKRMYLSYKTGLGKIYTEKEIELQRKSPSFEKEYNLRFEFGIGNIFHYESIDHAINQPYNINITNSYGIRHMGIDPAWGSSKFGVVVTEWYDNSFNVLYADSWERPLFDDAMKEVITLAEQYQCCKLLCDGSNPSVIKSLKRFYGSSEYLNYDILKPEVVEKWVYSGCEYNKVVPLNWQKNHRTLLQKAHRILSKHKVRINPKFTKLITSLRTATCKQGDTFDLDKQVTSENDVLDAFIASLAPIKFADEVL